MDPLPRVRPVPRAAGTPRSRRPGLHLARGNPQLDHLQRYTPAERLLLLGQVDDLHAAFAERLDNLVGTNLAGMQKPA